MNILAITVKGMWQRKFASFLTLLSVAIGAAMVVSIHVLKQAALNGFTLSQTGIDLVVGPKGDPLSLVLQGVYHKGQPQAALPLWFYYDLRKHPAVDYAIPISLGDSYQGCRVVGTSREIFSRFEYIEGRKFAFSEGGPFTGDFQGVVGSAVAKHQKIKVGDTIKYSCGLSEETADAHPEHEHKLKVVGVLKPTYTPSDWLIYVSYQSYVHLHEKGGHHDHEGHKGHDHSSHAGKHEANELHDHKAHDEKGHDHKAHEEKGHDHEHGHKDEQKGDYRIQQEKPADGGVVGITDGRHDPRKVSLILVKAKAPLAAIALHRRINDGQIATAAIPSREILNLFDIIGGVTLALHAISMLVILVAAVGIMVAIYNSMSERTHDIAVMRALGASRRTVEDIILTESALTCVVGGVLGIALGYAIVFLSAPLVTRYTNTNIFLRWSDLADPISRRLPIPLIAAYALGLLVLALLGMLVGLLPARKAYRIDVAGNLASTR